MTLAIAHRGEPVGHLENTLPSFRAAVAAGADMVEIDIRLTRDHVPVILHDATLQRTFGDPRPVGELTAPQLAAVRSPGGDRVPTLAEIAELAVELDTQLMVDLPEPRAIKYGYRVLADLGVLDRCLFAGRSRLIRRHMPEVRVALSWDGIRPPDEATLAYFRPDYFNPHFQLLTAGIADAMHERGIGISVWTVDHPRDMAAVLTQGADAVITNRIASLVDVIGSRS